MAGRVETSPRWRGTRNGIFVECGVTSTAKKILDEFRGEKAVDRRLLAESLIALGKIGLDNDSVEEIDVNPLKFRDGKPVAVDALVVLASKAD